MIWRRKEGRRNNVHITIKADGLEAYELLLGVCWRIVDVQSGE